MSAYFEHRPAVALLEPGGRAGDVTAPYVYYHYGTARPLRSASPMNNLRESLSTLTLPRATAS